MNKDSNETKEKSVSIDDAIKKDLVNPLADISADDFIPTPLESYHDHQIRVRIQFWSKFESYAKKYRHGVQLLSEAGAWPKCQDPEEVTELFSDPEELREMLDAGGTLAEALEFSDEDMDTAYTVGFELAGKESLEDATAIFLVLTHLDPHAGPYWIALGLAEYKLEHWESAVMALTMGIGLDDSDLMPYFALVDSLMQLERDETAAEFTHEALEKAKERDDEEEAARVFGELADLLPPPPEMTENSHAEENTDLDTTE